MDLRADLKWIQQELEKVDDYTFIEAVKSMINSLKNAKQTASTQEMKERAEASLKAIANGETRPITSFKKEVDTWKSQQAI